MQNLLEITFYSHEQMIHSSLQQFLIKSTFKDYTDTKRKNIFLIKGLGPVMTVLVLPYYAPYDNHCFVHLFIIALKQHYIKIALKV